MTVISLSKLRTENWTFRIDSEFLKKEYLKNIDKIKNIKSGYLKLNEAIVHMTGGATPLGAEYSESGVSFLRVQNIMQNYFSLNDVVYISEKQSNEIKRSVLKFKDVLLTITGVSYGKSATVTKKIEGSNINQHSVKITLNEKINPYFLSTFLNCSFGKLQSDKNIVGVTRPALDYEVIKNFNIPIISENFQNQIESIIQNSELVNQHAETKYSQAETLLLETLGLNNFEPTAEAVNVKNFKESFLSSGRLDAEYYQKKYDDYINLICSYPNGYEIIEVACKQKDINYTPKDNTEYKYIELANIGKTGDIKGCTIAIGSELPTRARRKVNTNDVIISSIEGSLDSCALVTEEYDNALCSTGFYIISSNKINSEALLVLFKSEPIQNILRKGCSGTILTAINKTEFQNIPIPIIDKQIQGKIASLVSESFTLKKQSEQLLETAKRAVEIAIEDSEEVAMRFINKSQTYN